MAVIYLNRFSDWPTLIRLKNLQSAIITIPFVIWDPQRDCMFQEMPGNRVGLDMKHFTHLKTIKIYVDSFFRENHIEICSLMKIFSFYSKQILSNVENIIIHLSNYSEISISAYDWNFIECAPKLRCLVLFGDLYASPHALKIVSNLLRKMTNVKPGGDIIEIKIANSSLHEMIMDAIDFDGSSIKISKLNEAERVQLKKW